MNVLAILGSAREGDTRALLNAVVAGHRHTVLDLRQLAIGHFEYGGALGRDQFSTVVDALIAHERIVFATPVYWYSMSGRMKVLFDRLTDLVTERKDLGRLLRGRTMYLLACGTDPTLPIGFEVPFRDTATYFGMSYGGAYYGQANESGLLQPAVDGVATFSKRLFS